MKAGVKQGDGSSASLLQSLSIKETSNNEAEEPSPCFTLLL